MIFRQAKNHCKRVFEAVKLAYANKTKNLLLPRNLALATFGKSGILPLFHGFVVLSSSSDQAQLFAKNLSENSNLDDSGIFFPAFSSRINVELQNIHATPKLVKKIITNPESSKASSPDCIPVVVLKKCEPELSHILAETLQYVSEEILFSRLLTGFIYGPLLKTTALLVFFHRLVKPLKNL